MAENEDVMRAEIESLRARLDALERSFDEQMRAQTFRLRAIEMLLRQNPLASADMKISHSPYDVSNVSDANESEQTPCVEPTLTPFEITNEPPRAAHQSVADAKMNEAAPQISNTTPDASEMNAQVPFASNARARTSDADFGGAEESQSNNRAQFDFATEPNAEATARRLDLESRIGGKWFNWIGIIAVCFAVAFTLKYAFDKNLIGAAGRVLLGGAGGLLLLIFAERLRARGYASYSFAMMGGAILILYLTIYAAFGFYGLIGQLPAFVLMSAVTALAVLLAARHNALTIAVLGLIGGFLTPLLLSTGRDNELGLFSYIALLDAGVLALAYLKSWRSLNHMAFVATVLMFAGWLFTWYALPKLWLTCFFLTLFFLLFSALAVMHNLLPRRRANWLDLSLIISSASFYFGTSYELLNDAGYHNLLGSFALLLSAFYVVLYYAAHRANRPDRLLRLAYLNAAIIFFTLAAAIQLDQYWITIGWAMEALALTLIGLTTDTTAARRASLVVFFIALVRWLGVDLVDFALKLNPNAAAPLQFTPLLNARAFSGAALIAALFAAAHLYKRAGEDVLEFNEANKTAAHRAEFQTFRAIFLLAANALIVILLSVDANDYFTQKQFAAGGKAPFIQTAWGRLDATDNARQFAFTAIWTLCAVGIYVFGIMRRMLALRVAGGSLLFLTLLKVCAFDLFFYPAMWHTLLVNQTFFAFALLAAAFACLAALYARSENSGAENNRQTLHDEALMFAPTFVAVSALLLLVGLSAETLGFFDRAQSFIPSIAGEEFARLENHKQFALTAVWTIYAGVIFYFGIRRYLVALRYCALALLTVAGAKILLTDARFYDAAWHLPVFNGTFVAFALFVAALLFVRWLYQRNESGRVGVEETRFAQTATIIVGNFFALTALSLEASGYFNSQIKAAQNNPNMRNALTALGGEQMRNLKLAKQLSLSVVWAIYGGALLIFGFLRRSALLRGMAIGLLGATILKVFFFDLASLDRIYRIISFFVLGIILLAVSFLYQQRQRSSDK
jgi:uncharacterized membrane protein